MNALTETFTIYDSDDEEEDFFSCGEEGDDESPCPASPRAAAARKPRLTIADISCLLECAQIDSESRASSTASPEHCADSDANTPTKQVERRDGDASPALSLAWKLSAATLLSDEDSPLPLRERLLASSNVLNTPSVYDRRNVDTPASILHHLPHPSPKGVQTRSRTASSTGSSSHSEGEQLPVKKPAANKQSRRGAKKQSPPGSDGVRLFSSESDQDKENQHETSSRTEPIKEERKQEEKWRQNKKFLSSSDDDAFENFLTELKTPKTRTTSKPPVKTQPKSRTKSDVTNSPRQAYIKTPASKPTKKGRKNREVEENLIDHDDLRVLAQKSSESDEAKEIDALMNRPRVLDQISELPEVSKPKPAVSERTPAPVFRGTPARSYSISDFPETPSAFLFSKSEEVAPEDYHVFVSTFHLCSKTVFSRRREALTKLLFHVFNHTVFESKFSADFVVEWNKRLTRTAGQCVNRSVRSAADRAVVRREASIQLSTKVIDSADRLRDTLVHEMCHAAVWLVNGERQGHGPLWKLWARKANLTHRCLPVITRCHSYEIHYKFYYQCVKCANRIGRHSKSLDTTKFVCSLCNGALLLQPKTTSTSQSDCRRVPVDVTPAAAAGDKRRTENPFMRFVAEHYKDVRAQRAGTHADTMGKLAEMYKGMTL